MSEDNQLGLLSIHNLEDVLRICESDVSFKKQVEITINGESYFVDIDKVEAVKELLK